MVARNESCPAVCCSAWFGVPLLPARRLLTRLIVPHHTGRLLRGELASEVLARPRPVGDRAAEVGPGEVAAVERRPAQVRTPQHRPGELAPPEVGGPHV